MRLLLLGRKLLLVGGKLPSSWDTGTRQSAACVKSACARLLLLPKRLLPVGAKLLLLGRKLLLVGGKLRAERTVGSAACALVIGCTVQSSSRLRGALPPVLLQKLPSGDDNVIGDDKIIGDGNVIGDDTIIGDVGVPADVPEMGSAAGPGEWRADSGTAGVLGGVFVRVTGTNTGEALLGEAVHVAVGTGCGLVGEAVCCAGC